MQEHTDKVILLVEDNEPAREATTALLQMMGYHVLAAAEGRTGLDLYYRHRHAIQLILTDLVMPEMGGIELYRRIRSENSAVAVLLMTGYPLEGELQDGELNGNVEWLQKPFTVKQLTHAVRRLLDQTRSHDGKSAK